MIAAQTELAQRQSDLRRQQLVGEVVRPAEAEAERLRTVAKAEAEKMKIQAEAAASYNRVALDQQLIDQLPQIVKEAAAGLTGANVNILNGADGLGDLAAGLVGQGLHILDSVRRGTASPAPTTDIEHRRDRGRPGGISGDGDTGVG
ncbi:MAG: flotillin domain-containing protein [Streptosporangiaceae bacterium]